jgi:ubiquinone/menaquinone biosynthesis C-methylase UbiE
MKLNENEIRDYWRNQAITFAEDHRASWADVYAINLEIAEISKRLRNDTRVIDIGCANGFSTVNYARRFNLNIKGVDYIPEMIAAANDRLSAEAAQLVGAVSFAVGDITALDEPDGHYDTAIVTRVIINLAEREKQIAAIREAARIIKPGGALLLSEATREGLQQLNLFRSEWGLQPIPEPPFNNYVDEELARTAAPDLLDMEEISNFSSTYFVGTRVLKPLLAGAIGNHIDPARAEMEWNRFFSLLPAAGDYGTQKLFIFRRR